MQACTHTHTHTHTQSATTKFTFLNTLLLPLLPAPPRDFFISISPLPLHTSLQEGLWGAPPNWSRSLVTYQCPANYCNCTGIAGERSIEGCALIFTNASLSCNPNRKGMCNVLTPSSLTLSLLTPSSLLSSSHPPPSHSYSSHPHPSSPPVAAEHDWDWGGLKRCSRL